MALLILIGAGYSIINGLRVEMMLPIDSACKKMYIYSTHSQQSMFYEISYFSIKNSHGPKMAWPSKNFLKDLNIKTFFVVHTTMYKHLINSKLCNEFFHSPSKILNIIPSLTGIISATLIYAFGVVTFP